MDKFFSILGKVFIILVVLGAMAYGGYYFGTQTKNVSKPEAVSIENNENPTSVPVQTATPKPLTTINGGVNKSAGLSFDQYTIKAGTDWKVTKENQTAMDEKLTLSKDGYSISIFQAATGGALCLYTGDPDFEGPSSRFTFFKELTTLDNRMMRRSGEQNGVAFTICQKGQDGSYQQPTNYGHISIKLPNSWPKEMLDEIDSIIASLKKV